MTKSLYADRDTVGQIAIDAAAQGERGVCAGDMGHEILKSLVEDLNECIASDPYSGKEFYITIHETKDLNQKNLIKRRVITTLYRPFPEPNTAVWRTDPKSNKTWFCWSLPHWSLFQQYLVNSDYYVKEQINDIKAFLAEENEHFGFHGKGKNVCPILNFKDRELPKPKKHQVQILL